jgi:ADP-heptose:LPS heptosyltransferase
MNVRALGKAVDRWARGVMHRGASGTLAGPARTTAPDWDARPTRLLLMRYDAMGDTVLLTGLIRAIRRMHPLITLDALVLAPYVDVFDGLADVHDVLGFNRTKDLRYPPRTLLARVRANRYDAILDAMVVRDELPTASLMLMLAARAPIRIGMRGKRNSFLYNVPLDDDASGHHVDRLAGLGVPFGIDPVATDFRPRLALSDVERAGAEQRWRDAALPPDASGLATSAPASPVRSGSALGSRPGRPLRLLVNVSAADANRYWVDDRFVEVIRQARARRPEMIVLVTGAPNHTARVAAIAAASGVRSSLQPLRDAFALVAAADAVLTPDTGITHVAAAFDRPTVSLHQKNKWMWTAYRVPTRALIARDNASLDTIPAADVSTALDALLTEQYGPPSLTPVGTGSTTRSA